MPIEIKELIIRATVDSGSGSREANATPGSKKPETPMEERIVARCMEQVMEYLRMQHER
jgi:hypothetical protein